MARHLKSTKQEMLARVQLVKSMWIEGSSTKDIVTSILKKYSITERAAYKYLKVAMVELWESAKENIEEKRKIHVQKRMDLYLLAAEKGDTKLALDILDSIAKLESLFTNNIDITTKGKSLSPAYNLKKLTEEELRKLDELTSKLSD